MINEDLYLEILHYFNNGLFMVDNKDVFRCENFNEIGRIATSIILEKYSISNDELKEVVCMRLNYNKEMSYDDMCTLICEKIIRFKTLPSKELVFITDYYEKTQKKYHDIIINLNNKILSIDNLIRTDKENPQNSGSLIKNQELICSCNATNKSLLKDLKKSEHDYISLHDEIQEKYVNLEMLKYAKMQIEGYFNETTINKSQEITSRNLKLMALELAASDTDMKTSINKFIDFDRYLDAWDNVTQSMYKSFFNIKMRKFHEDVRDFFYEHYNYAYWNKTEKLIELCKEKEKEIKDSDEWILIREQGDDQYLECLKRCVNDFKVLEYLKNKTESLYCIQKRKEVMICLLELFDRKNYLVFINMVVIQIEGIFYDLFFDANIQNRLNGQFNMFEKDDLKTKFTKNASLGNLEEATLYFKFYFNSLIRNKIAHGRIPYQSQQLEINAFELLLDLQYVIHLISTKSETNAAIEYIHCTLKWLETTFQKQKKYENIYAKLLNSLNANVIKSSKYNVSYTDPQQELYWIFNPYYIEAYTFANVIDERNKIINYLTSLEFWKYVNNYLIEYDKKDVFRDIKLKPEFISRINAIKMYVAKNKKEVLPILLEVEKNFKKLELTE